MKYSKQRETILGFLKGVFSHPTAESVYMALKAENPLLSLGTVYRNLSVLCDTGLARRIVIEGQPDRFDGRVLEHYHAVCSDCGCIFDVDMPYHKDIDKKAQTAPDFKINRHEIMFFGTCGKCEEKASS